MHTQESVMVKQQLSNLVLTQPWYGHGLVFTCTRNPAGIITAYTILSNSLATHLFKQQIRQSPDRKIIMWLFIPYPVGFNYIKKKQQIHIPNRKMRILLKSHHFMAVMERQMQKFIVYFNILQGKMVPCYSPWSLSCHVRLPAAGEFGEG